MRLAVFVVECKTVEQVAIYEDALTDLNSDQLNDAHTILTNKWHS